MKIFYKTFTLLSGTVVYTESKLHRKQAADKRYIPPPSGGACRGENKAMKKLTKICDGNEAAAYMEDSDLVLICRKIYHQPLDEKYMLDRGLIEYNYSRGTDNFHEMFVGEIVKVLVK